MALLYHVCAAREGLAGAGRNPAAARPLSREAGESRRGGDGGRSNLRRLYPLPALPRCAGEGIALRRIRAMLAKP